MSDDYDDDLSDDEIDAIVQSAVNQLLNLAAGVAELQITDQAAEEIYMLCDLVAEYHGIEQARIITEENADGSYTTRFEGESTNEPQTDLSAAKRSFIPGSIRTKGKPKLRLKDKDTPLDLDDTDLDD